MQRQRIVSDADANSAKYALSLARSLSGSLAEIEADAQYAFAIIRAKLGPGDDLGLGPAGSPGEIRDSPSESSWSGPDIVRARLSPDDKLGPDSQ